MTKMRIISIAAAVGLLAFGATIRADDKPANPLDRALDDSSGEAKPADAAKPDAAKPVKGDNPQDTLNPDAANALDTQDLINKLTGKGPQGEGPAAMMKEMLIRMDTSAQRLHDKDPGAMTQETQKRIVMSLDQLIEMVREMQKSSSSQSQSKSQDPAQKREQTQGDPNSGQHHQGGNVAASRSVMPNDPSVAPESNGTDMTQHSKEWGMLPQRDRDLITHWSQDQLLPGYKELIQHYYQSLAGVDKATENK